MPVEQRSAEAKRLFTAKDVWDAPGFAALYLNDEGMLDANVKGKVIVVRGAVERIESRGVPNAVYLGTRDRESTVGCSLLRDDTRSAARLRRGQKVSIAGTCTGLVRITGMPGGAILLRDCIVLPR